MILYITPDALEHTLEFMTDVITSYDGTEQRIAIRKQPKQRFSALITYDNYLDLRQARADIFLNTDGEVYLPLWHEGVKITSGGTFGTADAQGDFSKSDLTEGDQVIFFNKEGEYQILEIDSKSDTEIELTEFFDDDFEVSTVYPVEQVYVMDPPAQDVYPTNAGSLQLGLLMVRQPAIVGYGGTSFTTFSSHKVLTQRPIMDSKKAGFMFDRGFEAWETENAVFQDTATPFSTIVSTKRFLIKTPTERQNWKKFFADIAGGREAFWVPTWQSDLEVVATPSSTALKISADLDYKSLYYDTNAIKNLALIYDDGVLYRSVTNCVVNGDGTQTLTLNTTYPSTVRSVSFLELSRLASDNVTFSHYPGYSELKFSVVTTRG